MKTLFATGLLLLFFSTSVFAAGLDDLILITEEYPPFNFTEDGVHRGIATDLLMEMLAASGALKSHKDVASIPWARGYRIARKSSNILLYSVTRTEAREKLFKWVGPIVEADIVLLQKKSHHLSLEKPEQINSDKLHVGVVLDDVGEQLLKERHVDERQIFPLNNGRYLAQMLKEDRIDLAAYDSLVLTWQLKRLGANPDDYSSIYTLNKSGYYYALSLDVADNLVERLQKELDRLKRTGRLDAIINNYLQ